MLEIKIKDGFQSSSEFKY